MLHQLKPVAWLTGGPTAKKSCSCGQVVPELLNYLFATSPPRRRAISSDMCDAARCWEQER